MKNSTHVIIWGSLSVPIGLGLFIILPPMINNPNWFVLIMLVYFCGYGFFIQELLKYFEKREKQKVGSVE